LKKKLARAGMFIARTPTVVIQRKVRDWPLGAFKAALAQAERWERRYGARYPASADARREDLRVFRSSLLLLERHLTAVRRAASADPAALARLVYFAIHVGDSWARYQAYTSPSSRLDAPRRQSALTREQVAQAIKNTSTFAAAAAALNTTESNLRKLRAKYGMA
jgi:hypothetical protein